MSVLLAMQLFARGEPDIGLLLFRLSNRIGDFITRPIGGLEEGVGIGVVKTAAYRVEMQQGIPSPVGDVCHLHYDIGNI